MMPSASPLQNVLYRSCVRARPAQPSVLPLLQPRPRSAPVQQIRNASLNAAKYKRSDVSSAKKKKKQDANYKTPDLSQADQFALCDAMRFVMLHFSLRFQSDV